MVSSPGGFFDVRFRSGGNFFSTGSCMALKTVLCGHDFWFLFQYVVTVHRLSHKGKKRL